MAEIDNDSLDFGDNYSNDNFDNTNSAVSLLPPLQAPVAKTTLAPLKAPPVQAPLEPIQAAPVTTITAPLKAPPVQAQLQAIQATVARESPKAALAPHTLDADSQYKIAKKKETLVKKLDTLRRDGNSEDTSQFVVDQVHALLEDFEQEYKVTMLNELDQIQAQQRAKQAQAQAEAEALAKQVAASQAQSVPSYMLPDDEPPQVVQPPPRQKPPKKKPPKQEVEPPKPVVQPEPPVQEAKNAHLAQLAKLSDYKNERLRRERLHQQDQLKRQIKAKEKETLDKQMKELEEKKERDARMKKVLESQEKRLKRREELEQMRKISKSRVKKIQESQGGRYLHEIIEDDYQKNVVIPEIERQKALLDQQKLENRKKYEAIQKERLAYSKAMTKSNEIRRVGSNRATTTDDKGSINDMASLRSQPQISSKTNLHENQNQQQQRYSSVSIASDAPPVGLSATPEQSQRKQIRLSAHPVVQSHSTLERRDTNDEPSILGSQSILQRNAQQNLSQEINISMTGLPLQKKNKIFQSRNMSQVTKSRVIEQTTPGRQHKVKEMLVKQQVDTVKSYSEVVRQAYKPKVSQKKIKEMAELKAKVYANRPRQPGEASSPDLTQKGKKLKHDDYLGSLRAVSRDNDFEDFGLKQQRQRQNQNQSHISLDSLKINDPLVKLQMKNQSLYGGSKNSAGGAASPEQYNNNYQAHFQDRNNSSGNYQSVLLQNQNLGPNPYYGGVQSSGKVPLKQLQSGKQRQAQSLLASGRNMTNSPGVDIRGSPTMFLNQAQASASQVHSGAGSVLSGGVMGDGHKSYTTHYQNHVPGQQQMNPAYAASPYPQQQPQYNTIDYTTGSQHQGSHSQQDLQNLIQINNGMLPQQQAQQMRLPPGSPVIDKTITGLTQMELELRLQNDELNRRIEQVMDNQGNQIGRSGQPRNELGHQIQNMMVELDNDGPTGGDFQTFQEAVNASSPLQKGGMSPSQVLAKHQQLKQSMIQKPPVHHISSNQVNSAGGKAVMMGGGVSKSVQEAREIDNKYLHEIETKLGLLNGMINKN